MRRIWDEVAAGHHVVVLGEAALEPASLEAVLPVCVDCTQHRSALGPLIEAHRQIARALGEEPQGVAQVAAEQAVAGLRRRLLGEEPHPRPGSALVTALNRLADSSGAAQRHACLVLEGLDEVGDHLLETLAALLEVEGRLRLPLVMTFAARELHSDAARELLQRVRERNGVVLDAGALRRSELPSTAAPPSTAPALQLPAELDREVLRVLRAGALIGESFEAELVADLLRLDPLTVLEALQRASDLGVALEDLGEGRLRLEATLREALQGSLLPSLARAWHQRLARLLSPTPSDAAPALDAGLAPAREVRPGAQPAHATHDATSAQGTAPRTAQLDSVMSADTRAPDGSPADAEDDGPATPPEPLRATDRPQPSSASGDTRSVRAGDAPGIAERRDASAPAEPAAAPAVPPAAGPSAAPHAAVPEPPPQATTTPPTPEPAPRTDSPRATDAPGARSNPSSTSSAATTTQRLRPSHRAAPPRADAPRPRPAAPSPTPQTASAERSTPRRRRVVDEARAADHALAAGQLDAAAQHLLAAAHQAALGGHYAAALDLAMRGLSLLDRLPLTAVRRQVRILLLAELGRIQWIASGPGAQFTLGSALRSLEQARGLIQPDDPLELRVEIATLIASVCYDAGDRRSLERALEELAETSRALVDAGRPVEAARLLNDQAAVWVRLGDFPRANHLLQQSREVFEVNAGHSPQARAELAETHHLIARLTLQVAPRPGHEDDAVALGLHHARAAEDAYRDLELPREAARVKETLARLEVRGGDPDAALLHLEHALDLQQRLGDVLGLARTTATAAEVLAGRGDVRQACTLLQRSIALNLEKGSLQGLEANRATLAIIAGRATTAEERRAVELLTARLPPA